MKQMTPIPATDRFTALSYDDILYRYYSYDGLEYVIDVLKGFYESYKTLGQGKEPLFDKKCNTLKFEIVAHFCHYAEDLGAFLYPCHKLDPSLNSTDILENISKYQVREIDSFYQDFNDKYTFDDNRRNNFSSLFGYDHLKQGQGAGQIVESSLTNIQVVLRAIAEFYNFWKDSYNAYKHGYRLWFGNEYNQQLNVVLYLRKYNKLKQQNSMDPLPIDDKTINDVHSFSKYCRHIFDIIFDNHKALLNAGTTSNFIEFNFLEYKEPTTKVIKKQFKI